MKHIVCVAAAQYPLDRFDAFDGLRQKIGHWVAEAAGGGADLLVFPEYGAMETAEVEPFRTRAAAECPEASAPAALKRSLAAAADAAPATAALFADLARRHEVHILAPSGPARCGDAYVNRACLFAPSGAWDHQDKQIMTPFERAWGISPAGHARAGGHDLKVFDTALGTIGIAICYDSEFPLLVRALCEAGADLVLIPSCTEHISGYNRVRTAAMARALENGCVTVQSSTVGDAPWSPAVDRNSGAAGVFAPAELGVSDTGVLAEGTFNAPGWVFASVASARIRAVRTGGEMRNTLDWPLQPGADGMRVKPERVDLC